METITETLATVTTNTTIVTTRLIRATCNCCHTTYTLEDNPFEIQEMLYWTNTGGYGSVFGDGTKMEIVICQNCLFSKFQPYMQIIVE